MTGRRNVVNAIGCGAPLMCLRGAVGTAMPESNACWRSGRLPAELTRLVGRHRELAEARRLLALSRLVTLSGPAGVGKSRVALRLAAEVEADFVDGVCVVELAGLPEPRLLAHSIATALNVQDQTVRPMIEVLVQFLARKHLLLVLDTCEAFVDECAQLTRTLLQGSPGLQILITSRQPLGVLGEHTLLIPPLAIRAAHTMTDEPDAVALFADRAAAVVDGFTVTPENEAAVIGICQRLDGMPLAIELAAVRLRALSVEQVLARLDDRFQLLTEGNRAGVIRHQTLRVAIGWSHELCTPFERLLWSRLAVFPADFDLDAAEDVCADERLEADLVFAVLAQLVEKSIVQVVPGANPIRYQLLNSVREYGREWTRELGEDLDLRRRHRDRYLALAERGETEWFSAGQEPTFQRTQREHANLRAALEFSLSTPEEIRTGVHLAGTLWFYWVGCGYLGEGRHWLDRALDLELDQTNERAKALWVNGYISVLQGDSPAAVRMLRNCMAQAVETHNATALAYSIHRLGCAALVADDHPSAATLFQDALDRYEAMGELNSNVLMARIELAMAIAFQGDLDGAERHCEEVRRICEIYGEQWSRAYALYVLSFARWTRGEAAQASALAKESLRINHLFHDMVGCVLSVELLALYRAENGEYEEAAVMQGAAQQIWRVIGLRLFGSPHFNAPHEACERMTRDALGDPAYTAAYQRGNRLDLDAAVAYALSGGPREHAPAVLS